MNCSPNFTEWTREEEEVFAMAIQRHAEVENDRIDAESRNSAVTGATKAVKKEKNVSTHELNAEENKTEYVREWDRGKPDKDYWQSPEHHESSFKTYRSSGRCEKRHYDRKDNWGNYSRSEKRRNYGTEGPYDKRNVDRRDTWSGYSRNESTDNYRQDHPSDVRKSRGNYRYKQNDNQHILSRPQVSPKRTRGVGYRSNDYQRKSQSSYSDYKYKKSDFERSHSRKKYSVRGHSRSSSRRESDYVENRFTTRAYNLWQIDKVSEEDKQNRVERWVKSVNKYMLEGKQISSDQKDKNNSKPYSEFDRFEHDSNKSSEEDENAANFSKSKSYDNSNYTSHQQNYTENEYKNKSASYNVEPAMQNDGIAKKSVHVKHSSQYSSTGNSKNESFRKQRRFDGKGCKNFGDRNKFKPRVHDNTSNDDTWKNSDHDYTWKNSDHDYTWKNSDLENTGNKNSSYDRNVEFDNSDTWNQDDDGIWGNTKQSNTKWKSNYRETDVSENKSQTRKCTTKSIDTSNTWNDNQITKDAEQGKFTTKDKNKMKKQVDIDDGMWSNVDQSHVKWKCEAETSQKHNKNLEPSNSKNRGAVDCALQKTSKTEPGDGWEDYEDKTRSNVEESNWTDEKFETSTEMASNIGTANVNVAKGHSSSATRLQQNSDAVSQKSYIEDNSATYSAEMLISSFKHSLYISDEKSTNLSIDHFSEKPVGSDDGGWSTVSDEVEIHSDDEDRNKNIKPV